MAPACDRVNLRGDFGAGHTAAPELQAHHATKKTALFPHPSQERKTAPLYQTCA
jgi:hypothetical protein